MADQKLDRIHNLAFFSKADKHELEHVASAADEVSIEAGHVIVKQGRRHNECFVVESGTAEVIVDDEIVAEIPEGEMIGELGIFDPGPASATVRAKTAVDLLVIPLNRIDQILDENPSMVKALAQELSVRLRAMDARHC